MPSPLPHLLCRHVPSHASKELVLILASLTSRDPGDVRKTIETLQRDKIRCSVIGLCAEVRLCKILCKETNGG